MMLFHDAMGQRKTKTGATALSGIERPENVWQVLSRDATTSVPDNHGGETISGADLDTHGTCSLQGLDCVQKQIQKYLVDLIAVVLDFRQIGRFLQFDLDWS